MKKAYDAIVVSRHIRAALGLDDTNSKEEQ